MIFSRPTRLAALAVCLLASVGCRRDGNGDGDPRIADPTFPYPDYDPPTNPDDDLPGHNDDPFETVCEAEPAAEDAIPSHVDLDDGGADSGEPAFSVHAGVESVVVPQGGSVDVAVSIDRVGLEPIDVTVDGLPAGVTASPLRMGVLDSSGVITLTADPNVAYLASDRARVRGHSPSGTRSVALDVQVRGMPGRGDGSFGDAGAVHWLPMLAVHDVVEQPNAKLLVTGRDVDDSLLVCRLARHGAPDTTFGGPSGCSRIELGFSDDGTRLRVLPNGKILVGLDGGEVRVVRLDADGDLDASFGTDGVVELPGIAAGRLDILPVGGKILVSRGQTVVRLHANGEIDRSFGTYGRIHVDSVSQLLAHGDCGAIVAGGDRLEAISWSGSRDLSFGSAGVSELPFGLTAATTNRDGEIFVTDLESETLRLTANGSLSADYAPLDSFAANALRIAKDGRIVIGGNRTSIDTPTIALARRNADGSPDDDFCGCHFGFGGTRGVRVLRDGRYLVFGGNVESTSGVLVRVWD